MILGTQTITVHRTDTTTEDEYHNEVPGEKTSRDIDGCSVQPGGGGEYVIDRSATQTALTVWAPIDSDVIDEDVIEYAGQRYEINGSVQRWEVGTPLDHIVVPLKRWEG